MPMPGTHKKNQQRPQISGAVLIALFFIKINATWIVLQLSFVARYFSVGRQLEVQLPARDNND